MKHWTRCAAVAVCLIPQFGLAAFADPVGPQTTVWEVPGYFSPTDSALAVGRDGQSIIVWKDTWLEIPVLKSQRFAADGTPVGAAEVLTGPSGLNQSFHSMVATIASDGVATIAWEARSTFDAGDIQARRVGSDGLVLGDVFTMHGVLDGAQTMPSIASDSLNHVLVTWTAPLDTGGYGVFGRLLNGWGGFQFDVARVDENAQPQPVRSEALLGDCCEVTVAWQIDSTGTDELRARTFSLNWFPLVPESTLATYPDVDGSLRFVSRVGLDEVIRIVAVNAQGLMQTQRFDNMLQPVGSAAVSLLPTAPDAASPIWLGLGLDGQFALAWRQQQDWWTTNMLARFDVDGVLQESRTLFPDIQPDVASLQGMMSDADGDLVLAWQQGANWMPMRSLRAARFGGIPNAMATITGDQASAVIEPGSSFVYQPHFSNFSGAPSNFADIGILTGVAIEITLDTALQIDGMQPASGWTCEGTSVVTCRKARVERGEQGAPVALMLRAPASGSTLHNQFHLSHLETACFPDLNEGSQILVLGDRTPHAFAFPSVSGVPSSSVAESTTITLSGFDTPTDLYVDVGDVSINGGTYTCCAAQVNPGSTVRLRHSTPSTFSTTRTTVLTIGGVTGTFTSTTEAIDTTPNAFAFVEQTGLATNVYAISAPITIAGINAAASASIVGGSYRINGGAFTTANGAVVAGDTLQVRVLSASTASTSANATLTIGGVSETFSATTGTVDSTPEAFTFPDVIGARRGRDIATAPVTITGISTTVSISIVGGGATYSVNKRAYTNVPGTLVKGDTVRLRMTSSATPNARVDTTVTIGGISDTWSITTAL